MEWPKGNAIWKKKVKLNHTTKIKVVMLIGELGFGGTERQLYLLLRHFDLELFEPIVVVLNPSHATTYGHGIEALGIKVIALPDTHRGIFQRSIYLYRLFRQLSPHIVHSWTVHDNPYAGLIGYLTGVPLRLGSVRGSLKSKGFKELPWLFQLLSLHVTRVLAVNSVDLRKELVKKKVRRSRVCLLENCVETESAAALLDPLRQLSDLGIGDSQRIVGIVGNLRMEKNHLMFVDGLAKILSIYPDVVGAIVGQSMPNEANYPARILSRIAAHGIEGRIVLAGFHPNVSALMRRFTVFCLTSDYEGTPNVVLEAMAAARPVVATRVGGIPDLVEDGVTGILVEPGDVAGFAYAVKKLLEDRALAEQMGRAGRELVERRYSCEQAARQLARLYLQGIERG